MKQVLTKTRNSADFDSFYREYAPKLFGVAYRMVRNQTDALDIVQESFLRAYNNWNKFKGKSKLSTWLYRIILNYSYDFLRKRNRQKRADMPEGYEGRTETFDGERQVRQSELADKVKAEIEHLTVKQKTIFVLKTYEELSYQEIAEVVHSRIGTVKATYFQSVQKIRKRLKEQGTLSHGL